MKSLARLRLRPPGPPRCKCSHSPHNGVCYATIKPRTFCACRGENPPPFWVGVETNQETQK